MCELSPETVEALNELAEELEPDPSPTPDNDRTLEQTSEELEALFAEAEQIMSAGIYK